MDKPTSLNNQFQFATLAAGVSILLLPKLFSPILLDFSLGLLGLVLSMGSLFFFHRYHHSILITKGQFFFVSFLFFGVSLPLSITLNDALVRQLWDGLTQAHGLNPYRFVPNAMQTGTLQLLPIFDLLENKQTLSTTNPVFQIILRFVGIVTKQWSYGESIYVLKIVSFLGLSGTFYFFHKLLNELDLSLSKLTLVLWNPLLFYLLVAQGSLESVTLLLVSAFLYIHLTKNEPLAFLLAGTLLCIEPYLFPLIILFILKDTASVKSLGITLLGLGSWLLPFIFTADLSLTAQKLFQQIWQLQHPTHFMLLIQEFDSMWGVFLFFIGSTLSIFIVFRFKSVQIEHYFLALLILQFFIPYHSIGILSTLFLLSLLSKNSIFSIIGLLFLLTRLLMEVVRFHLNPDWPLIFGALMLFGSLYFLVVKGNYLKKSMA